MYEPMAIVTVLHKTFANLSWIEFLSQEERWAWNPTPDRGALGILLILGGTLAFFNDVNPGREITPSQRLLERHMCDTNRTGIMGRGKKTLKVWVGRKGSMDTIVNENVVRSEGVQNKLCRNL